MTRMFNKSTAFPWLTPNNSTLQVVASDDEVSTRVKKRDKEKIYTRYSEDSDDPDDCTASEDEESTDEEPRVDVPRTIRPSSQDSYRGFHVDRANHDEVGRIVRRETGKVDKCEYNLKKHVISYLPPPEIKHSVVETIHGSFEVDYKNKDISKKNLTDKSEFLRIQNSKKTIIEASKPPTSADLDAMDVEMDPDFQSLFAPNDMRLLALVSHNTMDTTLKQFVMANKNVLKKFRLTGTETTMQMLQDVFREDDDIVFGPTCKPGPIGGDAQLVAMAVTGQLGGCIFLIDPMDERLHSSDLECLNRQGNINNILMVNNPTTAHMTANLMRVALKMGRIEMIPSFFYDLESAGVDAHKKKQVLKNAINRIDQLGENDHARETRVDNAMMKANDNHRKYMMALQVGANVDFVKDRMVERDGGTMRADTSGELGGHLDGHFQPLEKPSTLRQLGNHLDGHFAKPEKFGEYWTRTSNDSPYFKGPYARDLSASKKKAPKQPLFRRIKSDSKKNPDDKPNKKPTTLAQLGDHLDKHFTL